jgi:tellurite resistance protein TerB
VLRWIRKRIDRYRARNRDRDFADLLMTGVALVAMADRDQGRAELQRRDRMLARLSARLDLDVHSALHTYDRVAERIASDPAGGRADAMGRLADFEGSRAQAAELVRGCLAIARSDRSFSAEERSVVEEICRAVRVDPRDFGVYDL